MPLTARAVHAGILVVILVSLVIAYVVLLSVHSCHRTKTHTYGELKDALGPDLRYKDNSLRMMAERIYDYKIAHEKKTTQDAFVNIFLFSRSPDPYSKSASSLSDVCLHKLATSTAADFPKLVYYIPMFNHPKYVECIINYNRDAKKFSDTTKATIINDILQFDAVTSTEAKWQGVLENVKTRLQDDEFLYTILSAGYIN